MIKLRTLFFTVFVLCFLHLYCSHGEIHRAKALKNRIGLRSGKSGYSRSVNTRRGRLSGTDETVQEQDLDLNVTDGILDAHHRPIHYKFETWAYSVTSAILVGLSGIFPLLVIPLEVGKALKHGAPAARLKALLSFAVGGLLGDVFLHLLPETWAHLRGSHNHDGHMTVGLWVLGGILTFLVVEKIFPDNAEDNESADETDATSSVQKCEVSTESTTVMNGHGPANKRRTPKTKNKKSRQKAEPNGLVTNGVIKNTKAVANGSVKSETSKQEKYLSKDVKKTSPNHTKNDEHIKTVGWLNLLANVIDNFTHGLAVAGSYCVSTKVGIITTVAILLHEVPHEVGDFAILLKSGFDRKQAAKAQLLTASGGILGAVTALTAESAKAAGDRTAWVLPFTSGGFIYIALVTVVPDLLKENNFWESVKQVVLLVSGIAVMASVTALFH